MPSREMNGKSGQDTSSRDFVIGAIVGAVAGAATALLLTPKSGKELRTSLNEQASGILEKSDQMKEKAMTKSNELFTTAKDKASTLASTVSEQSAGLLNKVKGQQDIAEQGDSGTENLPVSMEETGSITPVHTTTNEEIEQKLRETQKAFDETEQKLNR